MPVAKTSQSRGGWGCTGNQCRIKNALAKGLMDGGADVIDIGMVGTEEVYFATRFYGVDGGIQVTASHNPIDYNGMKLVKKMPNRLAVITGCMKFSGWHRIIICATWRQGPA